MNNPRQSNGFTLVELLIVITLIAILAGIVISILNPTILRNRARNGVRAGNVAKIAQALEAYNAAESSYPSDQAALQTTSGYIQNWPTDATYTYIYISASSAGCISVPDALDSAKYFKYLTSSCTIGTTSCAGHVMTNCTNSCSSANPTSTAGCVSL